MVERINSDFDIELYNDRFNFKVYAGPGAGKTFFLIKNIKATIEKSKKLECDEQRKILCITYTNVAADEIKDRLGNYSKSCHVSTIHSFLYDYVIKPYQQQLKIIIKKYYNIDIDSSIRFKPRMEGFGLLMKIKTSDFNEVLKEKYKLFIASEISKKVINECSIDLQSINKRTFLEDKIPLIKNKLGMDEKDLLKLKTAIWEQEGILDFDEILYFSYLLIKEFKFIAYYLRYTFPYILIDEYQDTNPIQNKIIELISNNKMVSIGVVGDISQSIYSFNGASYEQFLCFKPTIKEFKEFVIPGNRRSNQNIIYFLNYLRQADSMLTNQDCLLNINDKNTVKFILCKNIDEDIISKIDNDLVVVSRRWADVFSLIKNLKREQKNCVRKIHDFYKYVTDRDPIKDFEEDNIDWISQIKFVVNIKNAIKNGDFSKIIKECSKIFDLSFIEKNSGTAIQQFKEIREFLKLFNQINDETTYFEIMQLINNSISMNSMNALKAVSNFEVLTVEDEKYNYGFHPYLNNINYKTMCAMVEKVFNKDGKYLSVHKTKGKEYDSVFCILEKTANEKDDPRDRNEDVLSVLEAPKIFNEKRDVEISEFVRIVYVACSRARNNLYILLKHTMSEVENLECNLQKFMKANQIESPFYEFIDLN